MARLLFTRKLEQPELGEENPNDAQESSLTRHYRERLGDALSLLGEIALEEERYVFQFLGRHLLFALLFLAKSSIHAFRFHMTS